MLQTYRTTTQMAAPLLGAWLGMRGRKEDPARRNERFGFATTERPAGRLVWLHGASVGELGVLLQVRAALAARAPDLNFLVTTGTRTSAELFAQRPPERTLHVFAPLDTPAATQRFIAHWRPDLGVIAESELWPNLLLAAQERGVPMALVNATMSASTRQRWSRMKKTARALLQHLSLIIAADPRTASTLAALSGKPVPARGNLKLAADPLPVDAEKLAALRAEIGARNVWLAASTHEGEDQILIDAHRLVRANNKDLKHALLIIAPRHPDRGAAVAALADNAPRRSQSEAIGDAPIYVADTMGEMGLLYTAAPVSFIAGSLLPTLKGHNAIEPAKLGSAVVYGPHVASHSDTFSMLAVRGGAVKAETTAEVAEAVARLLRDDAARARQTIAARSAVNEGGAAFGLTIAGLYNLLPKANASTKRRDAGA